MKGEETMARNTPKETAFSFGSFLTEAEEEAKYSPLLQHSTDKLREAINEAQGTSFNRAEFASWLDQM